MNLRELLNNHTRSQIEDYVRARARNAYLGDSVVCRILGLHNMYVDPKNYDMAPWLMMDGLWEMWITMAIGRAIQPGWTCLDVGAWCGYYSVAMASVTGHTGKVLAFEPNQRHFELCGRSLLANGFTWGMAQNVAIGNKARHGRFLETDGGGSRLSDDGTAVVDITSIDALDLPNVDLIKMDIEGGEFDAWEGMQETIKRNPNIIIVMEVDANRYDAREFYTRINKVFPVLRYITTDGTTNELSVDELIAQSSNGSAMVWLQS